jgi:CRP-like cAMP-binding protein
MIDRSIDGASDLRGEPPVYTLADTSLARLDLVSDAERAALADVPLEVRRLAAGEQLIRHGSAPDNLYLLHSGWMHRSIITASGSRHIPTLVVPGGVCNLDNLLFERADFDVCAIAPATVLTLQRGRALSLAIDHPGVGCAFIWYALMENAILSQWAIGLGGLAAKQRLAHLLCELSIRTGGGDMGDASFDLPLTQEMIGDVIGLTSIHVNRTMQDLRAEGLIATKGRTMTIVDVEQLRWVAGFNANYLRRSRGTVPAPAAN